MQEPVSVPQITVLDTGGQYCHLIARKVRELGVYADVKASDTPVAELQGRKGIIISGGPCSVYEESSPTVDATLFGQPFAVLGICYGQHLMAQHLGGRVRKGDKGEYGLAVLEADEQPPLFQGVPDGGRIWMSHRDVVESVPDRFRVLGRTSTCEVAAMGDETGRLFGVQFHPEVVHTAYGQQILANYLFSVCDCERDWNPVDRIAPLEQQIRDTAGDRSILFFVSGGVDSTVAYTLCLRALGPERVRGFYVDTGFMRQGETDEVRALFASLGASHFEVVDARQEFLAVLEGVIDPEQKRHAIGEEFVAVQERILQTGHFLDGHWILGQGTIYPDTIESGGTQRADVIKTHHNRVAGIQRLLEAKRIIEPLSNFYKDEVREVGRELGIAAAFLERHPFPGPGLAIRCLGSSTAAACEQRPQGWLLPVRSVGVQGDSRSYRAALAVDSRSSHDDATELVNQLPDVNRVVALLASHAPLTDLQSCAVGLQEDRLERLRQADAIVRRWSKSTGYEQTIWQMPVVLLPLGDAQRPDSLVLRPVRSVDGMTAEAAPLPDDTLGALLDELMSLAGIAAVFLDVTHKPPGTIEWE